MRIVPNKQINRSFFDSMQRSESRQDSVNHQMGGTPSEGRALVVVSRDDHESATPSYRPAVFLAHLIATRDQAPQTRERRRASSAEATAAYRSVAKLATV